MCRSLVSLGAYPLFLSNWILSFVRYSNLHKNQIKQSSLSPTQVIFEVILYITLYECKEAVLMEQPSRVDRNKSLVIDFIIIAEITILLMHSPST